MHAILRVVLKLVKSIVCLMIAFFIAPCIFADQSGGVFQQPLKHNPNSIMLFLRGKKNVEVH